MARRSGAGMRQPIPQSSRAMMQALPPNKAICHYCGRKTVAVSKETAMIEDRECERRTADHIVPARRGGTKIVICCDGCNTIKADSPARVFEYFVRQHRAEFASMDASSRASLNKRYRDFLFDITDAGFHAVYALARRLRKQSDLLKYGIATTPSASRDDRGRFTRADLKRGNA